MSEERPDDLELLRQFREHDDQEAFTELVTRHVDLVYGTAYRLLRDTQLSEDASQRVFTTLARKGKRLDIRHLSSWLYAVTQREVRSMIRSESRRNRREREAFELEMLAQLSGQDREASIEALSGVLGDALKRLSECDQQALFLRFYEEQEFREIGTTLGIEERAAQKRVYRAMNRLRADLKKRGIVATAAIFSGQLFTAGACPAPTHLAANLSTTALAAAANPLSLASILESIRWSSLLLVGGTALTLGVGASVWKPLGSVPTSGAEQPPNTTSLVASRSASPTVDRLAIDDIEGIYRLKPQAKETALVALTDYLQSPHSEDYLIDLFTRWTRLDAARSAQAIVDIASTLTDATREDQLADLLQIPLQKWWDTNAAEAEDWQQSLPRSERGERIAFTALIQIVSLADPLQAFSLVAERTGTSQEHYATLADGLAQNGIESTKRLLTELPNTSSEPATSSLHEGIRFEESADRPITKLYQALLPRFFETAPQATADWVTSLPNVEEHAEITSTFVSLWADHAPADAADWASTEHPAALPAVTQAWLMKAESAAKDWLGPKASDPASGQLFGVAADQLGPESSLAWANQLGETPGATHLVRHAFFSMGLDEPIDTLNHRLESVAAEATRTHAATALAQGLLVGKGRGAVTAWRRSVQDTNPALAHALYLGELHVLAAIDPRTVAASILDQPRGEDRDQAIGVLLSRTINRDQPAREVTQPWVAELADPALRKTWERRFSEVSHRTPRKLPERLTGGFDAQTYREFQRRLDLLSTYPMKTP